jgi:uncharacterized membrane protein
MIRRVARSYRSRAHQEERMSMTTQTKNRIDSIAFVTLLLALAIFLVWFFVTLPIL